ncbi:MAG TPA: FAD-dependent oxidoreductase, partial [Candidatus Acidoferrum sp.]|nr:FAD-dependent oxidoreductase [Candidatus Acidoferrum sp.]
AGSGAWDCTLRDHSGAPHTLRARAIANATGAWAQTFPQSSVRLRLTKGVHLVIDRARLPVETAVVLTQGDRILFVIPWGDRVILGTTDTDYAGDPAEVRTEDRDARYILDVVNHGFPPARIAPADVIATWAGIRPLIAPAKGRAGAPSETSRRHEIRMPKPGWFDIAGGKLTTARFMAEEAVDRIGAHLGGKLPASVTASTPLLSEADARYSGVLPPPLQPDVVRHACETNWARRLDDVLLRRTSWHYYHGAAIAEEASYWMAQARGWTDAERVAELERFRSLI